MFKVLTILGVIMLTPFSVQGGEDVKPFILFYDHHFKRKKLSQDENLDESIKRNLEKRYIKIGDMLLTQEQYGFLYTNDSFKRHGFHRTIQLWPGGIVPVFISEEFDPDYVDLIKSAMDYISEVSCVKFKIELEPPPYHYVKIVKYDGCSSLVGRVNEKEQELRVGDYCEKGNVIHELLHALGFLHMHTAALRDDFVRINWKNIKFFALKNFEKVTAYVSMFDTQYDYRSIMHYTSTAFAIDRKVRTVVPFERITDMGQRESKFIFRIKMNLRDTEINRKPFRNE